MKSQIFLLKKNYLLIFLFIIFAFHLFFRFYQLEERFSFGWDQVDNAWAARSILEEGKYPLLGMVAKGNTGVYIGPIYYYYITLFYYLTNLSPIASAYIAGVTSIITFFTLYFVIKKLFSEKIALIAIFIHTFSVFIILGDRVQWPVDLIAPVSALVFYSLYKVLTGNSKFILLLAALVGFSFHVHFTSVFYPIIILFTLPFWPRTKEVVKNILLAVPLFLIFIAPILYANFASNASSSGNLAYYLNTYYHGFHLVRFLQLTGDALIELPLILYIKELAILKFFLLPIFYLLYLRKKITHEKKIISLLIAIWFLVPWLVFTTYSGEISNYYFFITRPIALIILAYITYELLIQRYKVIAIAIILFWGYYLYVNTQEFLNIKNPGLKSFEDKAKVYAAEGRPFIFGVGNPDSYFNYIFINRRKNK